MKIGILAVYSSNGEWTALKMHINLLRQAGFDLTIFVPESKFEEVQISCNQFDIVKFNKKNELFLEIKDRNIHEIWIPIITAVLKYYKILKKLNCNITLWVQGTVPYESYMRHKSKIRLSFLSYLEKKAMQKCKRLVYVSDVMEQFYQSRYKLNKIKSTVIPCLSEFEYFKPTIDKIPDSFVYIGGLSEWQCFDEILAIYSKIETENSTFHIITLDIDLAKSKLAKYNFKSKEIKVYALKDRKMIPSVLSQFQYGFLIRKNDPVNYVAAPIKFLEYLSCNINVIITDAIPSYAEFIKSNSIGTVLSINDKNPAINPYNPKARYYFEKYFSKDIFLTKYKDLYEL